MQKLFFINIVFSFISFFKIKIKKRIFFLAFCSQTSYYYQFNLGEQEDNSKDLNKILKYGRDLFKVRLILRIKSTGRYN